MFCICRSRLNEKRCFLHSTRIAISQKLLYTLAPRDLLYAWTNRGRAAAVSATARKLAVIIWNMIVKNIPYKPPVDYLFLDQKRKLKLMARIKKSITKFELKPDNLGFANASLTTNL